MKAIPLTRAVALTGVSYRRAHYWVANEVIVALNPNGGQGRKCWIPLDQIPVMRLLGVLSDTLAGRLTIDMLREIAIDFDIGRYSLGNGVTLTWEPTDFIRADDMPGMREIA